MAEETKKPERKVRVKFSHSRDYRQVPATGVYGGPNASGQLVCNFFIENREIPEKIDITIKSTGQVEEVPAFTEPSLFIRELQVGIVLAPHAAKSIGEWMIQKANELLQPPRGTKH